MADSIARVVRHRRPLNGVGVPKRTSSLLGRLHAVLPRRHQVTLASSDIGQTGCLMSPACFRVNGGANRGTDDRFRPTPPELGRTDKELAPARTINTSPLMLALRAPLRRCRKPQGCYAGL